jgi:hypothetical protein
MGLGTAKEKYIGVFLGISVVCLFISTTQGVIQIQGSTARWIEQAREGGEMVLLMAHPQMNIIGVVSLTLMSLGTYIVPRLVNRRLYSHALGKFTLSLLTVSVFTLYFTTLTLGILEGNLIREGKSFAQAREQVTGGLHDWILVGLYLVIGFAYFCYAYNVVRTVGQAKFAEGFSKLKASFGNMWWKVLNVNLPDASRERAKREAITRLGGGSTNGDKFAIGKLKETQTYAAYDNNYAADSGAADSGTPATVKQYVPSPKRILNQKLSNIVLLEIIGGWIAFLGIGWLVSRRPALGISLFIIWQTLFWICTWAVLVLLAPQLLFLVVPIYLITPLVSGVLAALSYRKSTNQIKQEIEAEARQALQATGDEVQVAKHD